MDSVEINIPTGTVQVQIVRKKIKNVHLKVYRDFSVVCSVPMRARETWIAEFVHAHSAWIYKQLEKYRQSNGYNNLMSLKSGSSTQMLGKDRRIYLAQDERNFVEQKEKSLTIHLTDTQNRELENSVFEKWWRGYALTIYEEIVSRFMPIFERHGIARPTITIKKMKTMWGSCSKYLGKITLNEYLLKADIRCIEYVVLHELTHLIYNGHNKDFYDFLTIYMPDWKARKKDLDIGVAQGL